MPNYIKNRIEILGTKDQVNEVLAKFSTHFEKEANKAYGGRLIYKTNDDNWKVGWLDEATGEFEERDKPKTKVIPEGFVQDFNEAWTRFPDFDKVITMPKSLMIDSGSIGDMGYSIINGQSENQFMDMREQLRRFYEAPIERRIEILEAGINYAKNVAEHGFKTWYDWSIANWGVKWNCSDCESVSDNTFDFTTARSGVPNLIEKMSLEFPEVKFIYEWSDEDTGANCGTGIYLNGEIELNRLENSSIEAYELAFKLKPEDKRYYELVDGNYEYKDED